MPWRQVSGFFYSETQGILVVDTVWSKINPPKSESQINPPKSKNANTAWGIGVGGFIYDSHWVGGLFETHPV